MSELVSRREWLAVAAAAPTAVAAVSPHSWNQPVTLGRSDLRVTRLGVGCEEIREPQVISAAVDAGLNYFHCFKPLQGGQGNMAELGRFLRPYRGRIVISTGTAARTADAFYNDLDEHLRLLATDTIDLWYLSSRQKPEHLPAEVLEAVRSAKRAGKIRAAAITTHSFRQLQPFLVTITDIIDAAMVMCNFTTWSAGPAEAINGYEEGDQYLPVKRAREAGLGIVAMKPLLGGLGFVAQQRKAWASRLTPDERKRALAAALRWVIANPGIDTAPVCVRNLDQLRSNLAALEQASVTEDRQLLSQTLHDIGPYYCRMCNQCEGTCRRQLPVADVMRYLLYHDGYNDPARARAAYHLMPGRIQKVRCQDCVTCTVICPNGVRVQEQITRAQNVLA